MLLAGQQVIFKRLLARQREWQPRKQPIKGSVQELAAEAESPCGDLEKIVRTAAPKNLKLCALYCHKL